MLILLIFLRPLFVLGRGEHSQITFPSVVGGATTTNVSILSSGIVRDFLLSIPSTYNESTAVPLIFSFHGRDKNASSQQDLSQFSNPSFNRDGIVVYPNGLMVRESSAYASLFESNMFRTLKE
jgi:poly(3-hydroxybutyrate) depolymerase